METGDSNLQDARQALMAQYEQLDDKSAVLKAPELKALFSAIKDQPPAERRSFGAAVNALKQELEAMVTRDAAANEKELAAIDVTAPMDVNSAAPELLPVTRGSIHPLMRELAVITDIFYRMGFRIEESREIDDQYHMFETLNFPADHPARDDYDTFMTIQTDKSGDPLVAPAHTSTMQHRVLKKYAADLLKGDPIAVVVPDRVFRNEDLDARHEHTFYQFEGIYVGKGVHVGMLIATLKTFLQEYYGKELEVKTQPFYFPFTEPSFEFALSCPFCDKAGCHVCSNAGWIELLGCGMIHPRVLEMAGIDPKAYTGFAWGTGLERLVMMKYGIEDVRHFESGKLDFLRQFS